MERLTTTEYEELEFEGVQGYPAPREQVEKLIERIRATTCRSCGYDVDDEGYCSFCGTTSVRPHV